MLRLFLLIFLGYGWTLPVVAGPLLDAAKAGNAARIAHVIDSGAAVHERGPQGDTPLHWAAFHGQETVVAQLIARGADVSAAVDDGNIPLHQAAYRGHTDVVKLLIAHGAEINRRTRNGVTPLGWAKRNGHKTVAQVLIAHGARDGAAPATDGALARRQTGVALRRADPLPDAVLFAALGYLPSLNGTSMDTSAIPQPALFLAKQAERPHRAGGFRVQLAAMHSELRAREMWQEYLTRHAAVLGKLQLTLEPAHVNGLSFYRVQGGPLTKAEARTACVELRRDNQACMVVSISARVNP